MAHSQLDGRPPLKGASAIKSFVPIMFLAGGSSLSETVIAAGSINDFQFGLTSATVASPGDPVSYWRTGDVGKGIAGASMGAGVLLAIGSTNGVLAPFVPSGLSTALGSAIGAAGVRWSIGISLKNAAPGDIIPVFIKTDQII